MAQGLNPQIEKLAHETGVEAYDGRGVVGTRIDQWVSSPWLDDALLNFSPTLILVSLGTNDEALGPGAADRQAPYLKELLGKLAGTGADIVWIGPPALPFEREGVSDLIRQSVPYYFASDALSIPRGPDNLHPTAAGYAGWAGALWGWLS